MTRSCISPAVSRPSRAKATSCGSRPKAITERLEPEMSVNQVRPCPCGSGRDSFWQKDARGIPLCRTCTKCHRKKMASYRPDVLKDPNYSADEAIEAD